MTYGTKSYLLFKLAGWETIYINYSRYLKADDTIKNYWKRGEKFDTNLRFFVEYHEAQEVSEVRRPECLPLDHDLIAHGPDLGEL